MVDLINWQCSCGTVYALERHVPAILHKNHPERSKCQKQVTKEKNCGSAFPDQAKRDELFKYQFGITESKGE